MAKYTKYPYQIKSVIHGKQVLSIESKLNISSGESYNDRDPIPPLETPGYSVFKLILIDDNKNSYTANIPEEDVPYMMTLTERSIDFPKNNTQASKTERVSKAYTFRFLVGKVKGKTPAEVLSNPDGEEQLLSLRKFLEANVSKYKANQEQIDIIDEAIALFKEGKLTETETPASSNILQLYKTETKYMAATDTKGNHLIYSVQIEKDPARKYSYGITVMNCKAPLMRNKIGLETPNMAKAEDKRTFTMWISEAEWYSTIKKMMETKKAFRYMVVQQQILRAAEINKINIDEAKK